MGNPIHSTANYYRPIPNNHFYTDLNQIIASIDFHLMGLAQPQSNSGVTYVNVPLTKEYLIIGLKNSIKNGYKIKGRNTRDKMLPPFFSSIDEIIMYIESVPPQDAEFFNDFKAIIQSTLIYKLNFINGKKIERKEVYKRIDSERDYQDMRWNTNLKEGDVPDEDKPPAEWINYMEYHLGKAKDQNYHLNKEGALEEIRKVAALAVRALEIHGCPERSKPLQEKSTTTDEVGDGGKKCDCGDDCECKKEK